MKDLRWEQQDIVKTEDYRLSVMEPKKDHYLVHCEVFNWSPGLFKRFLGEWSEIVEEFYKAGVDELYCLIPEEERQIGKFATMFGFEPLKECICTDDTKDYTITLILYRFPVNKVVEGEQE